MGGARGIFAKLPSSKGFAMSHCCGRSYLLQGDLNYMFGLGPKRPHKHKDPEKP